MITSLSSPFDSLLFISSKAKEKLSSDKDNKAEDNGRRNQMFGKEKNEKICAEYRLYSISSFEESVMHAA